MSNTAKTVIWVIVIAIVIWIGYALTQRSGEGGASGDVMKIGFIGPMSGDASAYGEEMQKIIDYRLAEINAKSRQKFEVVYEDGKCAGNDAVSAFQKLVDIDGIKVIIGGQCSSETLGIAPLTKAQNIFALSPLSSNPTVEGASPFQLTLSYKDSVIGAGLADEMKGFSRVAIISEQNDFNVGIKNVWQERIKQYPNVSVVANEVFPKGGTDFRNVLEKVKRANPEAILLNPNVGVTSENLLKQLAEMKDWKGYKIISQVAYLTDETRKPVGDFAEGMVIIDSPNLVDPEFLALKGKIEQEKGAIPNLGNYYTASTLDALDILTSVMSKVGNDPVKVKDMVSTEHFKGFLGDIYFGGKSFVQIDTAGRYVVQDGKAVYQPR